MGQLRLANHNGHPCPYCGETMVLGDAKRMPTIEHVTPRSIGSYNYSNRKKKLFKYGRTIVTCSECNYMKKDLTLPEFLYRLELKNITLLQHMRLNNERIDNIRYLIQIGIEE